MPRRSRINWPLVIGMAFVLTILVAITAWPILMELLGRTPVNEDRFAVGPNTLDQVRERATMLITGLWFFVFGATIGSFLNVVAYRMPMGLEFVAKPSRCPYCETPILFKHNVPILGWLALRGRCHACRLPISPRYILVEIIVGVLFFGLFWAELASGGRNLPIRDPSSRPGIMWNLFDPQWGLIGLYFFHAFLLGVLSTIALMKFDKFKIPVRFVLFTVVLGISFRWGWPELGVLPTIDWLPSVSVPRFGRPAVDLVVGLLAGVILQAVIAVAGARRFMPSCCGSAVTLSLVAVYLGWQAIVPTILVAALFHLVLAGLLQMLGRPSSHLWSVSQLVGCWLTLCFWQQLPNVWLPGAESPTWHQVGGLLLGLTTAFVAESWAKREPDSEPATKLTSQVESDPEVPPAEQSLS